VRFRSGSIVGVAGKQILLEDPAGNSVELFEYLRRGPRAGSHRDGILASQRGGVVTGMTSAVLDRFQVHHVQVERCA
jgi:hypothetical protein